METSQADPSASSTLLDILFREYPPLKPSVGRPTPREVPSLLLGEAATLSGLAHEVLEASTANRTIWRVGYQSSGALTLGLMRLCTIGSMSTERQDIAASWSRARLEIDPRLFSGGAVGYRCDYSKSSRRRPEHLSRIYQSLDANGDGSVRRYESRHRAWQLVEVLSSYTVDSDATVRRLVQTPTFDGVRASLPEIVGFIADASDLSAVSHGDSSDGIVCIGLDVDHCAQLFELAFTKAAAQPILPSKLMVLDHRLFDVEVRFDRCQPQYVPEVALWGVA